MTRIRLFFKRSRIPAPGTEAQVYAVAFLSFPGRILRRRDHFDRCVRQSGSVNLPERQQGVDHSNTAALCQTDSGGFDEIAKKMPLNCYVNWFDYDMIKGQPKVLRTRESGDRFTIDRSGRSRKLKSVMIDLKIPAEIRDAYPLAAVGDTFCGFPVSDG